MRYLYRILAVFMISAMLFSCAGAGKTSAPGQIKKEKVTDFRSPKLSDKKNHY